MPVYLYTRNTLPSRVRSEIIAEWDRFCRKSVGGENGNPRTFATAVLGAAHVVLVYSATPGGQATAFATLLDHTYHTTLDIKPKAVCEPYELYVDVMCADESAKGQGSILLHHIEALALYNGYRALRLYATLHGSNGSPGAIEFWRRKGFTESDTVIDAAGRCTTMRSRRRTYKRDRTAVRMTKVLLEWTLPIELGDVSRGAMVTPRDAVHIARRLLRQADVPRGKRKRAV